MAEVLTGRIHALAFELDGLGLARRLVLAEQRIDQGRLARLDLADQHEFSRSHHVDRSGTG